ncbi:hypothetical protein ABBQ38_011375 [Trebouxia sp. C0009 RCD-2024]
MPSVELREHFPATSSAGQDSYTLLKFCDVTNSLLRTVLWVFLTASPKLRLEVAKQFYRLRAAVLSNPKEPMGGMSKRVYMFLADVSSDAFQKL